MLDPIKTMSVEKNKKIEASPVLATEGGKRRTRQVFETLDSKRGPEAMRRVGTLFYKTYKSDRYSPKLVIAAIKKSYEKEKANFQPPLTFQQYLKSYGPNMVKLYEEKSAALNTPKKEQPVQPALPEAQGEKPIISPKAMLEGRITEIYNQDTTVYKTNNLAKYFGNTEKEVRTHIISVDPLTGKTITFLGKPIRGGLNKEVLPFLKLAEDNIRRTGLRYKPQAPEIGGYKYRGMMIGGKESTTPSFHKVGLAFDFDAGNNGPKDGRGNIPDQMVMAMVRAGFAWGEVGHKDFAYLGNDAMHFQLRFPASSPQGQRIINSSPVGKAYLEALNKGGVA